MRNHTDDSGQSSIEYALLIVVVLAIFVIVFTVTNARAGGFFSALWDRLVSAVQS
jgi:Flp pilus assembly pilin Flp